MPGPNTITALRGFKVRISTLNAFLVANGKEHGAEEGFPPFYDGPDPDDISALLREKVAINESGENTDGILYVVPSVEGHDRSPYAYIAYSYVHVYAQRRITPESPPEQVPRGFEELREEILAYSKDREENQEGLMGLFIVFTDERPSPDPPELQERYRVIPGIFLHIE